MKQALYNDVWQQLLDAERCYRYHSELADRYRKYQKIPRWIMAASSVVGQFRSLLRIGSGLLIYYMYRQPC